MSCRLTVAVGVLPKREFKKGVELMLQMIWFTVYSLQVPEQASVLH